MSDGIYSALSGAIAQQQSLDIVANNVANAGTVGFRADRVAFREAVNRAQGGPTPDTLRYVTVSRVTTDESAGPLTQTGNPLDLAISGDGMFAVRTPQGIRYTRAGSFRMDAEGVVRTSAGHPVLAAGGDASSQVVVPPGAQQITVGDDGSLSADGQVVGRFRVEQFAEGALEKQGLTMYVARGQGRPAEGQVMQGYLEGANVSPVAGMNELISASRSFEVFQRVIKAFKHIDERAARDVGNGR